MTADILIEPAGCYAFSAIICIAEFKFADGSHYSVIPISDFHFSIFCLIERADQWESFEQN